MEYEKYIVIDIRKDGIGNLYNVGFSTLDAAITEAKKQWDHLTRQEKSLRAIYVIESDDPDVNAENHLDGNIIWEAK